MVDNITTHQKFHVHFDDVHHSNGYLIFFYLSLEKINEHCKCLGVDILLKFNIHSDNYVVINDTLYSKEVNYKGSVENSYGSFYLYCNSSIYDVHLKCIYFGNTSSKFYKCSVNLGVFRKNRNYVTVQFYVIYNDYGNCCTTSIVHNRIDSNYHYVLHLDGIVNPVNVYKDNSSSGRHFFTYYNFKRWVYLTEVLMNLTLYTRGISFSVSVDNYYFSVSLSFFSNPSVESENF